MRIRYYFAVAALVASIIAFFFGDRDIGFGWALLAAVLAY